MILTFGKLNARKLAKTIFGAKTGKVTPRYWKIVENDKEIWPLGKLGLHNNVNINMVIIYKSIGFG